MKKRSFTAAVTAFMLLAYCINIAPAAAAPTGSGTELDPFLTISGL